jgi:hypothetical protein
MAKPKTTSNATLVSTSLIGGMSNNLNTDKKAPSAKKIAPVKKITQALGETQKTQPKPKSTPSVSKEVVKTVARKTPLKTEDVKVEKVQKLKMERDSFTMPKAEYAQLHILKERLAVLSKPVKKSELLRAGIMHLAAMNDVALKAALSLVPTIKTGRPKKK